MSYQAEKWDTLSQEQWFTQHCFLGICFEICPWAFKQN